MRVDKIRFTLHPPGHKCTPGALACSFGEAVYGLREGDNMFVTFAVGQGDFSDVMLVAAGPQSDDNFRRAGTYSVLMIDKGLVRYRRYVSGQPVIYRYRHHKTIRTGVNFGGGNYPYGEMTLVVIDGPVAL